ncbi:hypothetical protein JYG23_09530 [Sedimentibacter sp. zth1]|uniref:hypothetical protein n=1 Tax=Sedimentibacter sp. zth1 TaxID=2816908 RepID=UPI001A92B630|nr:hypothetical protein [Sedimentibacter sp. zth1]QSX04932.1 hypothetical protein JYG23_09530 [Sedimentibacter sp. zth1]
MEYIISEILKRKKSAMTEMIVVGILSVIILNIFITLTNNIEIYRNTICVFLLIIYCLVMYFVFKRMLFVYSYNLGEDCINFQKHIFKQNKNMLTVSLKNIKFIDKYDNIITNSNVQKTYYFIYGFVDEDCYYCEYETNNKIYRFVFKPSERLIRILERKTGR